jgi:hypothetical protein
MVALGLVALPLQIQAQPHEDTTQRDHRNEQPPAQTDMPTVNMVEDHAASDTANTPEDRAEQRQIDDLAAQQGMNDATKRMADLAVYQTWLIGIGTLFLLLTLWLTSKTNNAAAESVRVATATLAVTHDMAQRQLRAYLTVSEASAREENGILGVYLMLRNSGQTPARIYRQWACYSIEDQGAAPVRFDSFSNNKIHAVGPGNKVHMNVFFRDDWAAQRAKLLRLPAAKVRAYGAVSYLDHTGKTRRTLFSVYVTPDSIPITSYSLVTTEKGNSAT